MNIYDIKRKANELLVSHDKLFKVLLYIGIIQAVFATVDTLFSGAVGKMISLIITVLTVTLGHGGIVASLKTVNNMEEAIDEKEDTLVGLKKIGHLFPTYFLYNFIIWILCFLVGIIGFLIITVVSSISIEQFSQLFIMAINDSTHLETQVIDLMNALSNVFSILLIVVCLVTFVAIYLTLRFALSKYILQKYDLTGIAALKESSRLMKGNKWTLFKLEFSFIGWMFLSVIIASTVAMFLENILPVAFLVTFIESILATFISIYLYGMKLNVCVAVFYEELDYEDKYGNGTQDERM